MTRDIHPVFLSHGNATPVGPHPQAVGAGAERSPSSGSAPILALDQSSRRLGWARARPEDANPTFNTYGLPALKAPDGHDEIGAVLGAVKQFLIRQFEDHGVDRVFYETVYFDHEKRNPEMYGQLRAVEGIIRLTCIEHSRRCRAIEPKTWRKYFLGVATRAGMPDGFDLKDEAIRACARSGWSVADHHQAEAVGILCCAIAQDFPAHAYCWDLRLRRAP